MSQDRQDSHHEGRMGLRVMDMKVKLLYYLARDLMGADHFHFIRAYSAGLGEWVEALIFYHYQLCELLFAPGPVRIFNQGLFLLIFFCYQ